MVIPGNHLGTTMHARRIGTLFSENMKENDDDYERTSFFDCANRHGFRKTTTLYPKGRPQRDRLCYRCLKRT